LSNGREAEQAGSKLDFTLIALPTKKKPNEAEIGLNFYINQDYLG